MSPARRRTTLSWLVLSLVACLAGAAERPVRPGVAPSGPGLPALDATPTPSLEAPAGPDKGPLAGLEYRLVGPAIGGRVARVTGIPGDPSTYYAATAAGGVWKSTNGGLEWQPLFDEQPVSSIGSVAVAPSDPNVVWVGTGEGNIRGNTAKGDGVYRSTDGGKTWRHVLTLQGQIGALAVDPHDPDRAWAAVLGSPFGPTLERGVFRTEDGGATWRRVLFVDRDSGACDVALDPANPRRVWAATWQARRTPWSLTSGGPGSGLWVSSDGGDHWTRLSGHGLPDGIWGKVGVRVAPSDPRRVYALIEAQEGGLFRSDDGGDSWQRVSASRGLRQRAWYYSTLTVDPGSADVVWFPQVSMLRTLDAGETVRSVKGGGWDYHDLWIDPQDRRRMIVGSDAGVSLTTDGGATWTRPPLPIAQLYHVTTDSRTPYRVLGSVQDWGTASGPSNSLHQGGVFVGDWYGVGGGEAGHVAVDPDDPDVVYAGEYLGFISRFDRRTGRVPNVGIDPDNGSGHGAVDLPYRFQWTAPIVVSPHDSQTVYHAANVLFASHDGGQSWQAISPDLTRNDPSKQQPSGGPITGDNTGVEFYDTIFAVAESPVTAGVIWAGSDDGLVHVTKDGGAHWQKMTPPGMPEWATVDTIEPSHRDAGTAYIVADAHRLDDGHPYLWKTTDYGATWRRLEGGLDPQVYLHVVREDPAQPGLLYLGTDHGILFSQDDGADWSSLRLNLPTVAVSDLVVHGDDLVVGTIGRSIWILDDLGPVRQWRTEIAGEAVHLFAPPAATLWHLAAAPFGSDAGAGKNPPSVAAVTYCLDKDAAKPIALAIVDARGTPVRTLSSEIEQPNFGPEDPDWDPTTKLEAALATAKGCHRAVWDGAWAGAPYIPKSKVDTGDPHQGPMAIPGDYTVRLTVGGTTLEQPLRLLADPRSTVSQADREAQLAFDLQLRQRMTEIGALVARIHAARAPLEARDATLAGTPAAKEQLTRDHDRIAKLDAVERTLHNPDAEVTYDILAGRHGGAQLHSRYAWLFEGAREQEGPPTQGMREVMARLDGELAKRRAEVETLLGGAQP